MRRALAIGALATAVLGSACATKRPVLYPNPTLREAGPGLAQRDIDDCVARADAYGLGPGGGERVAKETTEGAAVGGAAGAAAGAVWSSAGRGAAAGAAGGAAGGFVRSIFGARDPDPLHRRFVERCLRDRGYEVLGWR